MAKQEDMHLTPVTSAKDLAAYILEIRKDPDEQCASYPFIDKVLNHIDLDVTNPVNGWSCTESTDFGKPFASVSGAVVHAGKEG